MVRIKVFRAGANVSCHPTLSVQELEPMEHFIAQIGYDSIKNIIVSSPGSNFSYYSIFYEDGQPYTPITEPDKQKRKAFSTDNHCKKRMATHALFAFLPLFYLLLFYVIL